MNNIIHIIRHTARAATALAQAARRATAALAIILLTAMTAWADTETVSYIDADGNAQTVTATVLTGNEEPNKWGSIELAAGWYVVKGDISYTNQITYASYSTGTIHIILADGAQMSVDNNGDDAILLYDYHPLAIYGQSAGTGRLSVTSDRFAITATGGITINGGIVSATSTGDGWHAIYANDGAITINGGQVTATAGDDAMGISTAGTITLGLRSTSDFITANGYYGTVNIKDGQALKTPSGNIYYGTLTDAQKSAIANVTLQPATQAEFIAAALPQTAADTYTISDATGWNVFCDLLADNAMGYFSGKTVQLGADITVTRMAGSTGHEFAGTFDGQGNTLFVNITGTVQGTAPFCEIKGATIRNLVVAGSVAGMRHSAGLVGFARGDDASVENTIENCLVATDVSITGDNAGYLGGIVGHGLKCKLTIRGCAFTGSLTSESYYTGGLQGWSDGNTLILENDIFAASRVNAANVGFHPIAIHVNNASTTATVSNVYYTVEPTCTTSTRIAAAGKQAHTVTAGENVTIGGIALTGTATQYTVSGITAYSGGGLQRGQTLYYGSGDKLSLTLSKTATGAPLGYRYDGYTASAGTLSGTTLTMPDQDVTISVALAPIDWATVNQGDSKYPYMIYNKDQLLLLAHRVNGTSGETANDYSRKYFKLGADITFSHPDNEGNDYAENYEAIGGNIGGTDRYFRGNFDGDGHTVSGIRIRKTGSDDADNCQGLFGQIHTGANIHDVHLTDARIKGYYYVGGIVGFFNFGTVSGCTVTDSHITAVGEYGTVCGWYDGTLTNNYYHGCTVNGTTVTSGKGCNGADIADDNGALPAYAITFGDGVSTTALASAPENGFVYNGVSYYREGLALPLASEAPEGYTLSFSAKGTALSGNTYTVNATDGDVTINTTLRSDGLEHEVNYMTADGTTQTAQAVALDGHEAAVKEYDIYRIHLAAGTYYVGTDITYANQIVPDGDVTLILADGKTMTLASDVRGIEGNYNLTIYGQSLDDDAGTLRYDGTSEGIWVNNYEQHSGNVSITTNGSLVTGIIATVTLRGGLLTISANGDDTRAIKGSMLSILGGHLTATGATGIYASGSSGITLGWTNPADFITASSYYASGTVKVADGQALTDGSGNIYTGTLTAADLTAIGGQALQPALLLADAADNTAAIADHAGQTLAVALSGRTLYKDGSWNTLCLPFDISTESGTLSGNNVQAMTLDTETSNLTGSTLTLNFDAATTIPAGTPFIIKWDESGTDIKNPVFMGVTIDVKKHDATVAGVLTFTGTYAPVSITDDDGDNTKLYLGAANKLYYPNAAMTIGTHRAYFQLAEGITAGEPVGTEGSGVRAFNLNFGGDSTGIISVSKESRSGAAPAAWYTLDGRRLDGVPTAKGLYINKGKKVIVK